jgi:hypothetical protein
MLFLQTQNRKMVGLHTVDAPPQTRQPKCQAFWTVTPSKMPSILERDANQNAYQICKEMGVVKIYSAATSLGYLDARSLWFYEWKGVLGAVLTRCSG